MFCLRVSTSFSSQLYSRLSAPYLVNVMDRLFAAQSLVGDLRVIQNPLVFLRQ